MKNVKRVLIAGTFQGLRPALAKEFLKRNYDVIVTARNSEDIQSDLIYKKVTPDNTQSKMIAELVSDIGTIDLLINNAELSTSGRAETDPEVDTQQVFEANLFGPVRMMESVIPDMRNQGRGRIVNIFSSPMHSAPKYGGVYLASKAALELVSRKFRFELRPFGIEVLTMQFGAVAGNMSMHGPTHLSKEYAWLDKDMTEDFERSENREDRPSPKSVAIQLIEVIEAEHPPFKTIIRNDAAYTLKQP